MSHNVKDAVQDARGGSDSVSSAHVAAVAGGCDVMGASTSSRQTVWAAAAGAWRSTRLFAMALLAIAVILGAHYRFHRLERWDMSSDEGASWASASLPSIREVVAEEQQLDPGKLALYDVTLHEWIRAFGDSLFVLRAMSAVLGTIVIVLLFIAVREVCRSLDDEPSAATGELAGAFAALIYATNFVMVVSDRTARMYPMMMAAELLQITFSFARSGAAHWRTTLAPRFSPRR